MEPPRSLQQPPQQWEGDSDFQRKQRQSEQLLAAWLEALVGEAEVYKTVLQRTAEFLVRYTDGLGQNPLSDVLCAIVTARERRASGEFDYYGAYLGAAFRNIMLNAGYTWERHPRRMAPCPALSQTEAADLVRELLENHPPRKGDASHGPK